MGTRSYVVGTRYLCRGKDKILSRGNEINNFIHVPSVLPYLLHVLYMFPFVFLSKVLSFFSLGTPASFHVLKTDSDHCAGMTYSFPVCGLETHIKAVVSGVSCQAGNKLSLCLVACGSEPKIVSEYDQEKTQSPTADNPVAPRGRAAQPSQDTRIPN